MLEALINKLSIINNLRVKFKALNLVEQINRDSKWHDNFDALKDSYKANLQDIKFSKIKSNYMTNSEEISIATKNSSITDLELENLTYNNDLGKIRDTHPVLSFIIDNRIYYLVQTSSQKAIKKPLEDELDLNIVKESIPMIKMSNNKYTANAIYVIEAKNTHDLNRIIEDVETTKILKDKFLSNYDEVIILNKKEKAFEIFYNKFLNIAAEPLNDPIIEVSKDSQISTDRLLDKTSLLDVTFNKYITDNIDRISNYENYRKDSWMEYLKLYEIEEINNKNDPTDI